MKSHSRKNRSLLLLPAGVVLIILFFFPVEPAIQSLFFQMTGFSKTSAETAGFYPFEKFIAYIKSALFMIPGLLLVIYGIAGIFKERMTTGNYREKLLKCSTGLCGRIAGFFRNNNETIFKAGFVLCIVLFLAFTAGYFRVKMDYVEGRNLQLLRNLTRYGTQKADDITDLKVVTIGPAVSLPVMLSFSVLGVSIESARLISFLYFILFLSVFLYLLRELFGKWVMLITFFTFIFLPRIYVMSIPVTGYLPALFFYTAGIIFFNLRLKKNKPFYLILAGTFWSLAGLSKSVFILFSLFAWIIFFLIDRFTDDPIPDREFFYPLLPIVVVPSLWYFVLSFIMGTQNSVQSIFMIWMHKYPPLKPPFVNAMVYIRNIRSWMGPLFPEFVFLIQIMSLIFLIRKLNKTVFLIWLISISWTFSLLLFDTPVFLHHLYPSFILWLFLFGYAVFNLKEGLWEFPCFADSRNEAHDDKQISPKPAPLCNRNFTLMGISAILLLYVILLITFMISQYQTAKQQRELTIKQYQLTEYIKESIPSTARLGGINPEMGKIPAFLTDRDYFNFAKDLDWSRENYLVTVYYSYTVSNYEGDMNRDLDEKLLRYWSLPLKEVSRNSQIEEFDLDIHEWELTDPGEEEFVKKYCVPVKVFEGYGIFKVVRDKRKTEDSGEPEDYDK